MMPVEAFGGLKNWALRYVRHRDLPLKKIAEIKETDFGFVMANNDGTSTICLIKPDLKELNGELVSGSAAVEGKSALIVALSNKENIQAVYSMWEALAASHNLVIVFVNPFSVSEEKWVLKPLL